MVFLYFSPHVFNVSVEAHLRIVLLEILGELPEGAPAGVEIVGLHLQTSENHGKTMGKPWENHGFLVFFGISMGFMVMNSDSQGKPMDFGGDVMVVS